MAMTNARVLVGGAPQLKRRMRRPVHTFQLRTIPWQTQPFLIAPVLPGETLKNLMFQVREVTDPIKHPLIGWWSEWYFFYVKHRDLYERDEFTEMVLNPAWSPANVVTAQGGTSADLSRYYAGGSNMIMWTKLCHRRVVDEYFRDEGETYSNHLISGMPMAQLQGNSWVDSLEQTADVTAQDVEVEGADANTTIQASEIDKAMRQWEMLRLNNLTSMSYEDYLQAHGIRAPDVELHRPELLRYLREWSYPSNTIDPTNGTPRSAVSWTIQERADKDRFFREPGFVFGLHVVRPKVYLRNLKGAAVEVMNNWLAWLPSMFSDQPRASMLAIADNVGPFAAGSDTTGYTLDVKDLLLYGDQFVNFDTAATDAGMLPLPEANLGNKRYPTNLAWIQELFVTGASAYFVKCDGVVNLSVLGSVTETSPRGGPADKS